METPLKASAALVAPLRNYSVLPKQKHTANRKQKLTDKALTLRNKATFLETHNNFLSNDVAERSPSAVCLIKIG